MPPKTRSIETQTDEEPTEKVEKNTQTSTTKDEETQSLDVKMEMEVDDKYIVVTLMNMCKLLIKYADKDMGTDPLYKDLAERFAHTVNMMVKRKYPVKLEAEPEASSRPTTRQQTAKRMD